MLKKAKPSALPSLKVLHVIPSISPSRGGPSKAVIEMVASLRRINIDAEIVTTDDDGYHSLKVPLDTLVDYQSVPIRFFKRIPSRFNAVQEFSYSPTFKSWLKQNIHHYDVVHIHAIFSFVSTYAMWLSRKRHRAYVVRPIGQLEDWSLRQSKTKKEWYLKLIERRNLEGANAIHFTASSEKKQAIGRFPALKAKTIPLGITQRNVISDHKLNAKLKSEWNIQKDVPVICYLSRLHPKKGLELLLEALSKLKIKNFQLVIAGKGETSYENALKKKISNLGLTKHCNFVGFVDGDEKQLLLQLSDIFALTSYSENFGIAVLEAMAAGAMPFISREVALSNIVEQHNLGVVCELNVEDIIDKLATQLADIKSCGQRAKAAQLFVEQHYQWQNIAKLLQQLYQSVQTNI